MLMQLYLKRGMNTIIAEDYCLTILVLQVLPLAS